MDHGRITERGTHRELLENQGAYVHMWALQQQEEAERNKEGENSHQAEAMRA
jgi:ABC-type transport system involved in cytochrome bd biosynthesis fused ATPase/permease subunit